MVTKTPLPHLKRMKAPKRENSLVRLLINESLIFSNLLTSTLSTRSPEFMFSELRELADARKFAPPKGHKLNITLATGEKIGLNIPAVREDL